MHLYLLANYLEVQKGKKEHQVFLAVQVKVGIRVQRVLLVPKVLLVILVTFFPMVVSLMAGYAALPRAYRDQLVSMGAGRWTVFRRATLPSARGHFFAGLRISATYAIVATIFAEYAGARRGLGIYILTAKNNFRADLVLSAVVVSALLTLTLLALIQAADRLTGRRYRRAADA